MEGLIGSAARHEAVPPFEASRRLRDASSLLPGVHALHGWTKAHWRPAERTDVQHVGPVVGTAHAGQRIICGKTRHKGRKRRHVGRSYWQYRVSFVFKGTCQTMQLCHTPTHILRVDYNKHTTDAMEQRQSTLLKLFSQASRPDIYQAPGSGYSLRRIAETVCCIGLLRRGQAFQLIEQSSSIATELHIAIV